MQKNLASEGCNTHLKHKYTWSFRNAGSMRRYEFLSTLLNLKTLRQEALPLWNDRRLGHSCLAVPPSAQGAIDHRGYGCPLEQNLCQRRRLKRESKPASVIGLQYQKWSSHSLSKEYLLPTRQVAGNEAFAAPTSSRIGISLSFSLSR